MIVFNTNQFQFSHGKLPRGVGLWLFECRGETFEHSGTFTSAKHAAKQYFAAKFNGHVEVTVMP